jgi:hypothetical protein
MAFAAVLVVPLLDGGEGVVVANTANLTELFHRMLSHLKTLLLAHMQ